MTAQSALLPPRPLARGVRVAVLLAGRIGRTSFGDGIRRSVLDLPVSEGSTVLDAWARAFDDYATTARVPSLTVRIAIDRAADEPDLSRIARSGRVAFEVVRDPAEYRGTAGVVRDLTSDLTGEDTVLVAVGSQLPLEPLSETVAELGGADEGVALASDGRSDLAALFLLRRARLERVPDVGFVDLKEQALAAGRGFGSLRAVRRPASSTMPLRTCAEYVRALRTAFGGADHARNPFAESWDRTFVLVEPGARVDPSAVLQDCVVLAGGTVEAGAIVARSVVCPGGVVRRREKAIERVVVA